MREKAIAAMPAQQGDRRGFYLVAESGRVWFYDAAAAAYTELEPMPDSYAAADPARQPQGPRRVRF